MEKGVIRSIGVLVQWEGMARGDSFFLQGAGPKEAKSASMAASRRGIKVKTKRVIEDGGAGVRVTLV